MGGGGVFLKTHGLGTALAASASGGGAAGGGGCVGGRASLKISTPFLTREPPPVSLKLTPGNRVGIRENYTCASSVKVGT